MLELLVDLIQRVIRDQQIAHVPEGSRRHVGEHLPPTIGSIKGAVESMQHSIIGTHIHHRSPAILAAEICPVRGSIVHAAIGSERPLAVTIIRCPAHGGGVAAVAKLLSRLPRRPSSNPYTATLP